MTEKNKIIDSVQHLFSCWWWPTEQSVSPVMLSTFLHSFQGMVYPSYTLTTINGD